MPVLIKDFADAKRKYAKLIRDYERDIIPDAKFRNLIYALSSYVNSISKVDFDERLKTLESKDNGNR